MDGIQILRRRCRSNGVLISNERQRVYLQGDYVYIDPVQANMIYVPEYDPMQVYVSERPHNGLNLLSFGAGLLIGAWLCNDTDRSHQRVYNTGWQGGGWIANSRSHVTINNTTNIYTANRGQTMMGNQSMGSRQVNLSRVKNYNLPATLSPRSQAPSRQSGTSMRNQQQVTRTNVANHVAQQQQSHQVVHQAQSRPVAHQTQSRSVVHQAQSRPVAHQTQSRMVAHQTQSRTVAHQTQSRPVAHQTQSRR